MNPIELTTLTRDWIPTEFPCDQLRDGTMPPMTIAGDPVYILDQSVHRICEPPQVWLTVMHQGTGTTYQVSLEDDYKAGMVSIRLMVGPY